MLKIQFSTSSGHVEDLKQDFENIKNNFGLPCEITPDFVVISTPRTSMGPAVTFYEDKQVKQGFPEIDANPSYYDLPERKLTLLHEIIHAYQRSGSLELFNKEYLINLISRLEEIQKQFTEDEDYNFTISPKLQMIYLYSTWILEIWDEMYLKIKYPDLYVKKLDQTYDLISKNLSSEIEGYGKWKKYIFLFEFVRAKYLQKITLGTDIESKFENLCKEWELRLQSCVDTIEFQRLMSKVEDLTNIEAYELDDPTSLKNAYEEMIQEMLDNIREL